MAGIFCLRLPIAVLLVLLLEAHAGRSYQKCRLSHSLIAASAAGDTVPFSFEYSLSSQLLQGNNKWLTPLSKIVVTFLLPAADR